MAMRGLFPPLAALRPHSSCPSLGARRVVLVQVDGLSRPRLERAMAEGYLPALAERLATGGHALSSIRSGAPSSTPAFQAGLFYGVSPSVPGFVWFDRRTGRELRMDRPADAATVETRVAAGVSRPLLRGGTSYFSLFSGGASLPYFCVSGLAGEVDVEWHERRLGAADALASAFAHAVGTACSAVRLAHEVGAGIVDGLRWSVALGRAKNEPRFLAHRLVVQGLQRELAVQNVLLDISNGVPAIYVDFLGFDEYAHRRGPDSEAALGNLVSIDAALEAILAAAEAVPALGYDVYVLSDHGHVATLPFESLAGAPLPEYVAAADRGEALPRETRCVGRRQGLPGGRTLGARRSGRIATAEAGDLAHVYFLDEPTPLPLEGVRSRHWRVLAALSASRGVGLMAVRGGRRGFALVRGEVMDLAEAREVARLPHPHPPILATYLSDLVSLPDSGDIVVLGWRGEGRPVVAYAWEFGSHGGVGPEETEAFIVHPAKRPHAFDRVIRPSELYRYFEEGYRTPAEWSARPSRGLRVASGGSRRSVGPGDPQEVPAT
ncbi:MAG TPA: alkaline phosphatase family protein [Anaeromyxobacter sp.]|nr:alkaline phosphatase family protein [Anaeromyxobacter sp.]